MTKELSCLEKQGCTCLGCRATSYSGVTTVNTFFAEQDYQYYLNCLLDASYRYKVSVHAYVLMTNHVHILATPVYKESISLAMQSIGRRYVQYVNKEYLRTGTLWESRHKASLVDAERYLLTCSRYIEMNPVAAGMVKHPADYQWSSYRANALGEANTLIHQHETYHRLGLDIHQRQKAYAGLFEHHINPDDIKLIRDSARCSMPTGDNRFKEQIERALNRKVGYAHRGRPGKRNESKCK